MVYTNEYSVIQIKKQTSNEKIHSKNKDEKHRDIMYSTCLHCCFTLISEGCRKTINQLMHLHYQAIMILNSHAYCSKCSVNDFYFALHVWY